MHIKRWITALILLPLLLLMLIKGSTFAFTSLVCIVSFLTFEEFFKITANHIPALNSSHSKTGDDNVGISIHPISIRLTAHVISFLCIIAAHMGTFSLFPGIIALNLIVLSFILFARYEIDLQILDIAKNQLMGVFYITLLLSIIVLIRNSDRGDVWIIWLLVIVAGSDTGAFYFGSYFGKTPLAPRVSPNKTVEGALGGIFAAIVLAVLFNWFFIGSVSTGLVIPFAFLTSVFGQAGDLFESVLKRAGKIKDSGSILPGHGGMLDRIDGLLFAAPVVYFFKEIIL